MARSKVIAEPAPADAAPPIDRAMALAIVFLRIGFGFVYFTNGIAKLTGWDGIHPFPGFLITRESAKGIIQHDVQTNPLHIYKSFILNGVVPHWGVWGIIIMLGELAVGICLILGAFTPIMALFGAAMQIHLNFADWGNNIFMWDYAAYWIPLLALAFFHAGRYWGLDSWIADLLPARLRRWPLV